MKDQQKIKRRLLENEHASNKWDCVYQLLFDVFKNSSEVTQNPENPILKEEDDSENSD